MRGGTYSLELQLRTITVSFRAAARTHSLGGDERALRASFDRAGQLLDSVEVRPAEREQLLEARDHLLQTYRHHLESCEMVDLPISGKVTDPR